MHCAGSRKGDEVKARHLVEDAPSAGTRHIVYISVVGDEEVPVKRVVDRAMFGYFASKRAAGRVIAESSVPWTTLRATQFSPPSPVVGSSTTLREQLAAADARHAPKPAGERLDHRADADQAMDQLEFEETRDASRRR